MIGARWLSSLQEGEFMIPETHAQQVSVATQVAKTLEYLRQSNHCQCSISKHRTTWTKFERYCKEQSIRIFTVDLAAGFLKKICGIDGDTMLTRLQKDRDRHMRVLCDYFQYGHVKQKPSWRIYQFPPQFEREIVAFINFRKERGYSSRTEAATNLYLERFGAYLDQTGVKRFSEISSAHLIDFIDNQSLAGATKPTISNMLSTLGRLFDFAFGKYHPENLSLSMPKSGYRRNRPLPSAYTESEVKSLLKAVDRNRPIGKRDYAILLLAGKLGLRMGDICALRFENFKWDLNQIELIQGKTGVPVVLPLLHEIGEAIIDYLKDGRPQTSSDHIFVRHQSPFNPFSDGGMGLLVKKYVLKANISVKNRKVGLHSLRHSLASSLLKENTPLPVISEILGHTRTNTTRLYLKIDADQLKMCALEVPAI